MDSAAGLEHEHDPGLDANDVGHLRDRDLGAEQRCDGGFAADIGDCGVRRKRHINAAVVASAINAPAVIAITAPPTYAALAANRTSPQPGGTTVTFSAGASRRCQPYSYKWWVKLNGGAWTLLQDWRPEHDPGLDAKCVGHVCNGIWARSNGVTADSPQTSAIAEFDVSASLPLSPPPSPFVNPPTSALIGVDRPGPQPTGTAVTFSASASAVPAPTLEVVGEPESGQWTVLRIGTRARP